MGWERGERQLRDSSPDAVDRASLSLPLVFDSLASSADVSRDLHVALEYRLPFNGQRIDLLLLGRHGSSAAAHVIELKHWAASAGFDDSDTLVEIQGSVTPHPSYQAASYVGKIRYLHAAGVNYQVTGTAAITAGSSAKHAAPTAACGARPSRTHCKPAGGWKRSSCEGANEADGPFPAAG